MTLVAWNLQRITAAGDVVRSMKSGMEPYPDTFSGRFAGSDPADRSRFDECHDAHFDALRRASPTAYVLADPDRFGAGGIASNC